MREGCLYLFPTHDSAEDASLHREYVGPQVSRKRAPDAALLAADLSNDIIANESQGIGPHASVLALPETVAPCSRRQGELPLTVVIPTVNEAAQISEAIAALAWADEIIVVDGGSTDGTPELAAAAGATVMQLPNVTIAEQRNAGIAAARNLWILALDADERITGALQSELKSVLANPKHEAYRIRFQNMFLGRELRHGGWGRDWHVRLFTRERRFIERRVHERLEPVEDAGQLRSPLLHTPYRDLTHYLRKMIRYARWGAEEMYDREVRANAFDIAVVPVWRFFRAYFLYSGWLDGSRGLLAAALGACAGLVKYAYLYSLELQDANRLADRQ